MTNQRRREQRTRCEELVLLKQGPCVDSHVARSLARNEDASVNYLVVVVVAAAVAAPEIHVDGLEEVGLVGLELIGVRHDHDGILAAQAVEHLSELVV